MPSFLLSACQVDSGKEEIGARLWLARGWQKTLESETAILREGQQPKLTTSGFHRPLSFSTVSSYMDIASCLHSNSWDGFESYGADTGLQFFCHPRGWANGDRTGARSAVGLRWPTLGRIILRQKVALVISTIYKWLELCILKQSAALRRYLGTVEKHDFPIKS